MLARATISDIARYLLPAKFGSLQSGWQGTECNSTN
jgi:hypothetical protein